MVLSETRMILCLFFGFQGWEVDDRVASYRSGRLGEGEGCVDGIYRLRDATCVGWR